MTAQFEEFYTSLRPVQREAADWQDGAFLLLAGPGTGKTRVLTCRAARLLNESPDERFKILCLTFTNAAADEMRNRLVGMCDQVDARSFVGTFHRFCIEILRQHGSHVGVKPSFGLLTDHDDKRRFFSRAMSQSEPAMQVLSRAEEQGRRLIPLIERLQDRLTPVDSELNFVRDRDLARDLSIAYKVYSDALQKENVLDFNSILNKTYELAHNFSGVSLLIRRTYKYWFVDEFQDTNQTQYRLLKELAGDAFSNIFVVADDDQILYQWNGASHKRLEEFREDFSPETLQLPTNHRCPPYIVEIANRLIKHNQLRTFSKKPLSAIEGSEGEDQCLFLQKFSSDKEECKGIADSVAQESGGGQASIAVLARNRYLLEALYDAVRDRGVSARIVQKRNDFLTTPYQLAYKFLRLVIRSSDPDLLESLVAGLDRELGLPLQVPEIIAWARSRNIDFFAALIDRMDLHVKEDGLALIGVFELSRDLKERRITPDDFVRKLATLLYESPDAVEDKEEIQEDGDAWNSLCSDIRSTTGRDITLDQFIQEADIRSKEAPLRPGEVALMTIHGAKGKEFDVVYLMGLAEEVIPSWQSLKKGPKSPELEEERRNCFVAITRTKQRLYLSYADRYKNWQKLPSRFLKEMGLI